MVKMIPLAWLYSWRYLWWISSLKFCSLYSVCYFQPWPSVSFYVIRLCTICPVLWTLMQAWQDWKKGRVMFLLMMRVSAVLVMLVWELNYLQCTLTIPLFVTRFVMLGPFVFLVLCNSLCANLAIYTYDLSYFISNKKYLCVFYYNW